MEWPLSHRQDETCIHDCVPCETLFVNCSTLHKSSIENTEKMVKKPTKWTGKWNDS